MKFIYRGRIAVFSIRVLRDERICVIAEQRPDCSEEEVRHSKNILNFQLEATGVEQLWKGLKTGQNYKQSRSAVPNLQD